MKRLFDLLLSIVYPNKCIGCGRIIDEGPYFCEECFKKLHASKKDKFCTVCGSDKEDCRCKYAVFRFEAITGSYKNEESAKAAFYAYKFAAKQRNLMFFSDRMVETAREFYGDIKFDYICYVPSSFSSIRKYGFNHALTLAREVAFKLSVPLKANALGCRPFRRHQHKSQSKQRRKNVIGKYYCKCDLSGATVLLIDDIKTTGASLDECTKELLFAGAQSVYCLTALYA